METFRNLSWDTDDQIEYQGDLTSNESDKRDDEGYDDESDINTNNCIVCKSEAMIPFIHIATFNYSTIE